jgi:hypothetical protein
MVDRVTSRPAPESVGSTIADRGTTSVPKGEVPTAYQAFNSPVCTSRQRVEMFTRALPRPSSRRNATGLGIEEEEQQQQPQQALSVW